MIQPISQPATGKGHFTGVPGPNHWNEPHVSFTWCHTGIQQSPSPYISMLRLFPAVGLGLHGNALQGAGEALSLLKWIILTNTFNWEILHVKGALMEQLWEPSVWQRCFLMWILAIFSSSHHTMHYLVVFFKSYYFVSKWRWNYWIWRSKALNYSHSFEPLPTHKNQIQWIIMLPLLARKSSKKYPEH